MPDGKKIDNKAVYARPEIVERFDADRRIGEDDFVYRWELDHFIGQARRLMEGDEPGSIIDVGAGTGKLALAFARLGWRVTAFDHSDAMLAQLRRKAEAEGLTILCLAGDIRDLARVGDVGLYGGGYDVAVSSRVLMHVPDPAGMIAAMAALARRGVVLDAPRQFSPNRLLVAARALTGGEVYRCFDDAFLIDAFARQGFETLELVRMFALPISLHVKLRRPALSQIIEAGLSSLLGGMASTAFVTTQRR